MGVAFVRQAKENGAMFSSAYINGKLKRKFRGADEMPGAKQR